MEQKTEDRRDLLVAETVDDLREVFLVDHAFPTEWQHVPTKTTTGRIRDWFSRVLGLRPRPSVEADGGEEVSS